MVTDYPVDFALHYSPMNRRIPCFSACLDPITLVILVFSTFVVEWFVSFPNNFQIILVLVEEMNFTPHLLNLLQEHHSLMSELQVEQVVGWLIFGLLEVYLLSLRSLNLLLLLERYCRYLNCWIFASIHSLQPNSFFYFNQFLYWIEPLSYPSRC